jgi:repressor of nif and glnA expression
MVPVFDAGLGMGVYATKAREGEQIGHFVVPKGKIAIGSVCSVTVNGVLLKAGIPTTSRFGGVLELHDGVPYRFTDMIHYEGTSLDPLEIFIKGGLTSVRQAASTGNGRIGAGFREVPTAALGELERVRAILKEAGLGGIMMIGKPNQPLLDIPVTDGRTGVIVAGGLNPASAVEEAGIPTTNHALSCLYEFGDLAHYTELSSVVRGK